MSRSDGHMQWQRLTRLHFQLTLWCLDIFSMGEKKRKTGLEMYAFHVTALSHVGVVQSAWSRPVKKEFIHSCFCAALTGFVLCPLFTSQCSAVRHFVPPNNRILRRRIRSPELSEVQIKSVSCVDKKKKIKKAWNSIKFFWHLLGNLSVFPPNRPTC